MLAWLGYVVWCCVMLCAMCLTEVDAGLAGVCGVLLCHVGCHGSYRGRCWLGRGMLCDAVSCCVPWVLQR